MNTFKEMITTLCILLFFTPLLHAETISAFSATPLHVQYCTPPASSSYREITFIIPAANKLRQAVRTVTLANKRQRAGVHTIILFESTAANLPVVQGIPYETITQYTEKRGGTQQQSIPKCSKRATGTIPPLIPEITIPNAQQIYLPLLDKLLLEHARLGGNIVLCPCCNQTLTQGIRYLPKRIAPKKLQHLKKQMKIPEGDY
ncbi:hypothetical protein [Halodesulfovibrio aestuarii]|uniref:hypothetical protein n=1 Tax=Halodesulfovibrio aestuarii TaxID=126333 RepID=UPI003D3524FF